MFFVGIQLAGSMVSRSPHSPARFASSSRRTGREAQAPNLSELRRQKHPSVSPKESHRESGQSILYQAVSLYGLQSTFLEILAAVEDANIAARRHSNLKPDKVTSAISLKFKPGIN
jgi:hypothetical protein